MPASDDTFCRKLIRDCEWMEAGDWLRKGADRGYGLGEFGTAESLSMVGRAYLAGARRVGVFDFYEQRDTGFQHSDRIFVELPDNAAQRGSVFEWARSLGHEPDEDAGQNFLQINLA